MSSDMSSSAQRTTTTTESADDLSNDAIDLGLLPNDLEQPPPPPALPPVDALDAISSPRYMPRRFLKTLKPPEAFNISVHDVRCRK